jgi:type I restriction-modification system DNA methylase subunit
MPTEMSFEFFREEMTRLTASFHKSLAAYRSEGYDESALRNDFLTPFWRALGWDVENKQNLAQSLREVQIESRVHIEGRKKRADYLFRTGGLERFVCEAKKPQEELSKKDAYQAQRYAFNLKLLVATLSNFEALQIFIVPARPDQISPWESCKQYHYTEYVSKAEELWSLFSRDAVASGSLEKYIISLPKRPMKGKARQGWLIAPERVKTVDADFLSYVEEQREVLAHDLIRNNKKHKWTSIDLNESIQRILDRILFVRISEDRDIDTGRPLELILSDWEAMQVGQPSLYSLLIAHFNRLDETFNGALFKSGHESETLNVSDEYLADLIRDLSSDDSPYLFSTLPVEILGSVYERFIGKVVRVTKAGKLRIELKPEVRKAGGVYYTPRYVVNRIVEETIGKLLQGRRLKDVERIKVLDPACGSGSFLIRVFEIICEYYIRWYHDHPNEQKPDLCYTDENGNLRLTTHLKRQIMLNNVFGVDIDYQAVEVTMLSLYLKILEGETRSTLGRQQSLFPNEMFLPDLTANLKCGNSLIGQDYYKDRQIPLLGDDDLYRVNAFDWSEGFPDIVKTGFDVVLGNPPWGAAFTEDELEYLRHKNKDIIVRMIDSFMYFVYKGMQLLKPNGRFGMILPDVALYQNDCRKLREYILNRSHLTSVLNMGDVFEQVTRPACIVAFETRKPADNLITVADFTKIPKILKPDALNDSRLYDHVSQSEITKIPRNIFITKDVSNYRVWSQMISVSQVPLQQLVDDDGIQRGVSPDFKDAFIVDSRTRRNARLEKDHVKRVLTGGKQVKRYTIVYPDLWLIYTSGDDDFSQLPNIKRHIDKFRTNITCKEVKQKKHSRYALHRARNPRIFTKREKLVGVITEDEIIVAIDRTDIFVTDGCYVFGVREGVNIHYIMALLNSTLFVFVYRLLALEEGRVLAQVKPTVVEDMPIRIIDPENKTEIKAHYRLTALSAELESLYNKLHESKSEHERRILVRQIGHDKSEINKIVFELYGLSAEDIALVQCNPLVAVPAEVVTAETIQEGELEMMS